MEALNIDMSNPRQSLSLKIGVGIAVAINMLRDGGKADAEEVLMSAAATGWALGRCSEMTDGEKAVIEKMWGEVKPHYDSALSNSLEGLYEREEKQ
ncbi:MAG: hypothetical protein LKI34_02915 [Bifidobacterium tibiigranuli]|jgi:hypothetical protein|uniref:hypothetical protein n=1 Tax=Bifidobacterium tibiigranuli TaxID=2172043 RepID=UPI0026F1D744|nr:hypothetical protein [Bifidobacterium tibiigranuli]MCI1673158.1 hypothetical protein [Bifidobacterium tibiigranuli]MCI1713597.1 hypothetical protein [Bifidobacterium tibiigranuli]